MCVNVVFWLIFVQAVIASTEFDDLVEFYVKTIQKGIAKSESFVGPVDASAHKPTVDSSIDYGKTFDFVIVGGGSAGAVIATRLSEDPNISVLLLEAGGHETIFGNIPGFALFLQAQEFNWNFNSTPQTTSCLGMTDRKCPLPRGKGLGGTSLINGLVYSRGNKEDYDHWRNMGNPEWGYDDVLKYFKKSENFNLNGDFGYHRRGGELNVEGHQPSSPQLDAFIKANILLGQDVVDYNGKKQLGVSKTQFNYISGSRMSTAKAFLSHAVPRSNLEVSTNSYVIEVLFKSTDTAYGVKFTRDGKLYTVMANKEVIISAGVVGSPHLLMLSGIGHRDHLESKGIPLIKNLPVGDNFQEHPAYFGLFFSTNYTNPAESMDTYVKQYLQGYGPYAIEASLQGVGFYKSKRNPNIFSQNPDIELIIQPSNNTGNFIGKTHHYTDLVFNTMWKQIDPQRSFTIVCAVLHPKSRGTVRLKSANPYDYPLIDTQILADEDNEDIETLYEAIQLALKIVQTEPFKKINAELVRVPLPQCIEKHAYLTKEFWYCQLRQLTFHLSHGSGTCKMGPTSVVDSKLKVHGFSNLRVADASIFPNIVAGHTNAPAIMVGEKVSDFIKWDWGYRRSG